jgi:hypothetical protein
MQLCGKTADMMDLQVGKLGAASQFKQKAHVPPIINTGKAA